MNTIESWRELIVPEASQDSRLSALLILMDEIIELKEEVDTLKATVRCLEEEVLNAY